MFLQNVRTDKKIKNYISQDYIFRITAGYTLFNHKRNGEILEELEVEVVDKKLRRYKSNCVWHVTRMNNKRMPEVILNYKADRR
jgi:hypothetical protein